MISSGRGFEGLIIKDRSIMSKENADKEQKRSFSVRHLAGSHVLL